jgi:DNA-binding IclR family transcriptional regulator
MQVRPLSSVLKCFDLLEVVAQQPGSVRISELSQLVGESRPTTYQRLVTLTTAGWLQKLPDGSFRLSTRAYWFAMAASEQAGFGERAQPVLDNLAEKFGEAVSLVLLDDDRMVVAQKAKVQGVLRADLRIGAELSYKDSASGGIWLTFGPDDLINRVAAAKKPMPSASNLRKIRADGVSISGGGKTLPGIVAVAVPVLAPDGSCIASLSITGPQSRVKPERFIPTMRASASQLAEVAID